MNQPKVFVNDNCPKLITVEKSTIAEGQKIAVDSLIVEKDSGKVKKVTSKAPCSSF